MEGTYPIIIDGQEQGCLEVTVEGLHTVFRGTCTDMGGLLRLSLYGEREGYLGVMVPEDGVLRLTRRLSRAALRSFPQKPSYAGPAGMPMETAVPSVKEGTSPALEAVAEGEPEPVRNMEETVDTGTAGAVAETPIQLEQDIRVIRLAEMDSEGEAGKTNDILWYAAPGGCLYSAGDGGKFLAVPEERSRGLRESPGVKRKIQGKNYLIFKTGFGGAARK